MKLDFDAELRGADGAAVPVYCEVQPPSVGGQKGVIRVAVPAVHISREPPRNPCVLEGRSGAVSIRMQGVHWRRFPASSKGTLGLESIELLHVERMTISHPSMSARKQIRFHLGPISYLRSESNSVMFGGRSGSEELFALDLPGLGVTRFVAEWVTTYHRDAEVPGATVIAGFSALADCPANGSIDDRRTVEAIRSALDVLSILFRQAVPLHGWTYTDGQTVSTWVAPLEPNLTPSTREDRGDFVVSPKAFAECATRLARAYEVADVKTRSLVRRIAVAVNPHSRARTADRYLFMFSAFERVIKHAWERERSREAPTATTYLVIKRLEQAMDAVIAEGGEGATEVAARLAGFIDAVRRASIRDKVEALLRNYPIMSDCCADLWPVLGSDKEPGLKDVRDALAHGSRSRVSLDVVMVAERHLAILLERTVFVLLGLALPNGLVPGSALLRAGGRGWYERETWVQLRSKPKQPI